MATFVNREKETAYLKNWMHREPNSLLFVYGPKSSGKTALITHIIENHIDQKKFAINYMNLRQMLVYNFQSFLDAFFTRTTKDKVREIVAGISMNIGFFKINMDDEAIFKKNPFKVMIDQLRKAQKKGLQPVIIIDEIQTLKDIYFNGERNLLDELFNLFVGLTKETHLAHVILLTSDSYFIEEIYNHSKLKKTAEFFHLDHLSRQDTMGWLVKENIEKKHAAHIWEKIGGSAWEISQILSKMKDGESVEDACEFFIHDEYGKLVDYVRTQLTDEEKAIADSVHQQIIEKGYATATDFGKSINPLIPKMVDLDFWFFQTNSQKITANSESIRWAMKRMLEKQQNN